MAYKEKKSFDRRHFLRTTAIAGTAVISGTWFTSCRNSSSAVKGFNLVPEEFTGKLKSLGRSSVLPGAMEYMAEESGDGIQFFFPKGTLTDKKYITADMLLDGKNAINFMIEIKEGEDGPVFGFRFSCLAQCGLRVRMPLDMVDMNRWGIDREGAFLKPRCSGERVNLDNVDRMRFFVFRKCPEAVKFSVTELVATVDDVPVIDEPILPKGALLDELGQSTLSVWQGKTKTIDEMSGRLRQQFEESVVQKWPSTFTRWGAYTGKKLTKGSGFFKTYNDGKRWWLTDPDGYAFFSAGLDQVMVDTSAAYGLLENALSFLPPQESEFAEIYSQSNWTNQKLINYLAANFIRTFGSDGWRDKWSTIALSIMRRLRFNTVGNWSEWEYAQKAGFPYVIPMNFNPSRVREIYRDFPDVFDSGFMADADEYALLLKEVSDDPALIGYFMMNEPQWAFSSEPPAVGMMFNTPECETRKALVEFIRSKYRTDAALSDSWKVRTGFDAISSGAWKTPFSESALGDLKEFSSIMVEKYFTTLSEACRKIDPNHLNLGIRYAGVPPDWVVKGMKSFDVFSTNSYSDKVPREFTDKINNLLGIPTIIGEWHFGALDVGLPFSGIGHLKDQKDRAKAYRIYFEDAAANPNCIGVHWYTLYDESALGRDDGEAYNIGFLDVCNKPYDELCSSAIKSHERMYDLADGKTTPFDEKIEYLPKLF